MCSLSHTTTVMHFYLFEWMDQCYILLCNIITWSTISAPTVLMMILIAYCIIVSLLLSLFTRICKRYVTALTWLDKDAWYLVCFNVVCCTRVGSELREGPMAKRPESESKNWFWFFWFVARRRNDIKALCSLHSLACAQLADDDDGSMYEGFVVSYKLCAISKMFLLQKQVVSKKPSKVSSLIVNAMQYNIM